MCGATQKTYLKDKEMSGSIKQQSEWRGSEIPLDAVDDGSMSHGCLEASSTAKAKAGEGRNVEAVAPDFV